MAKEQWKDGGLGYRVEPKPELSNHVTEQELRDAENLHPKKIYIEVGNGNQEAALRFIMDLANKNVSAFAYARASADNFRDGSVDRTKTALELTITQWTKEREEEILRVLRQRPFGQNLTVIGEKDEQWKEPRTYDVEHFVVEQSGADVTEMPRRGEKPKVNLDEEDVAA